jgi:poly-gamma-glutamate synthesis protein (capsule biosynthesis protein)
MAIPRPGRGPGLICGLLLIWLAGVQQGAVSSEAAAGANSAAADSILLSFVGDIMHHDQNAAMPDYNRIYDAVRSELRNDTLSFANIEFPVDTAREPSGYPLFNGSVEYVKAAVDAGFDVFALANNHTYDWGAAGARSTRRVFDELGRDNGTYHNGVRRAAGAAIEPTVITRDGWSIAFVSVTGFSNVPGSASHIHLVDYTRPDVAEEFLALVSAWDALYDLVIVGVHGGVEYDQEPDAAKVRFFRELVSHGADIVWGHHPHVIQPVELVSTGSSRKLILHSTGNFISAQRRYQRPELPFGRWAPTGDTAIFQVRVFRVPAAAGDGVRFTVGEVTTPVFTAHADPVHGFVLRRFGSLLTEPLPLSWRAFYAARYAATRSFVNRPMTRFTALSPRGVP